MERRIRKLTQEKADRINRQKDFKEGDNSLSYMLPERIVIIEKKGIILPVRKDRIGKIIKE